MSPRLRAEFARVRAARSRTALAGTRPDPMLMAGVQNAPLAGAVFDDDMTMKVVGLSQTIPLGGKLGLRTRVAELEAAAAEARLVAARFAIARDVRAAYYDIVFTARAMNVTRRAQSSLSDLATATEARYASGGGRQTDVLRARLDLAELAADGTALAEEQRAALARLNALLGQSAEIPIDSPAVPIRIVRSAIGDTAGRMRFVSAALGARVAGSPLPPLDTLQAIVLRSSPRLAERRAMIAVQAAREALARREQSPDLDVSVEYGQRDARPDMVSAVVSIELPTQRKRRRDAAVAEARSELAALEAELDAEATEMRAEVAEWHGEMERARAQLLLLTTAVVPHARATFASAAAELQAGRGELASVIEAQAAAFNAEIQYHRALTDFARALAELESAAGMEVVR